MLERTFTRILFPCLVFSILLAFGGCKKGEADQEGSENAAPPDIGIPAEQVAVGELGCSILTPTEVEPTDTFPPRFRWTWDDDNGSIEIVVIQGENGAGSFERATAMAQILWGEIVDSEEITSSKYYFNFVRQGDSKTVAVDTAHCTASCTGDIRSLDTINAVCRSLTDL